MLTAKGIQKKYGSVEVLKGVDLNILDGEMVSIVGSSGAGKSTLLHILGTLDQADSGSIIIHNTPLFNLSSKALASFRNKHIGFVFQFHHLLSAFTAIENVMMPLKIRGIAEKNLRPRAQELLAKVGLEKFSERYPTQL